MNGYGTDEGFAAWALANGHTVPAALTPAVARLRGSNYIDATYGQRFSGVPTGGVEQERAWPRTGASAYGNPIADTAVPGAVVNASYEAALLELKSPGSLSVIVTPGRR